ncbi:MAG: hypothetical protein HY823_02625 [Acidobacteria bacterium]|nr:hypothetical protein [Acidobacteriota bacterium]
MSLRPLVPLLALGFAPALQAQEPHFGFGFNLAFPTGEFRSRTTQGPSIATVPPVQSTQTEGFDAGFGGQFTISFPIQPTMAFRMNFGGQSTSGTRSYSAGYSRDDLQHNIFSLAGEMQLFLNGGANRHRGSYFFFGPSADFERWDYTYGRHDSWDYETYDRKSRMGANFGFGHSFGYFAGRFTMEVAFHKTLSGNDVAKGDPPSADFVKLHFGWVF